MLDAKYPPIANPPTLREQMLKIISEANEVIDAIDAGEPEWRVIEEYCDTEHAMETAQRIAMALWTQEDVQEGREYVEAKNAVRGYYRRAG